MDIAQKNNGIEETAASVRILTPREQLKQEVLPILRDRFDLRENSDGTFTGEIYAEYDDEMSRETACAICEDPHPMEKFYETLDEWYEEYAWRLREDLRKDIAGELEKSHPNGLSREEAAILEELIEETVYYDYPVDHYLKQEFRVNIMLDTGDGNYDFTLNSVYPCWYGRYGDRIDSKAGIVWLAKSQGYTKTRLWNALKQGDMANPKGFLESMRVELANLPTSMSTVTFLVRMTLEQLIALNTAIRRRDTECRNGSGKPRPNYGYLTVTRDTMTGLFDPWNGSGSVFEIELEQDVRLPVWLLRSALPDGGAHGYSVSRVYGMCESAWRDTVTRVELPRRIRELI